MIRPFQFHNVPTSAHRAKTTWLVIGSPYWVRHTAPCPPRAARSTHPTYVGLDCDDSAGSPPTRTCGTGVWADTWRLTRPGWGKQQTPDDVRVLRFDGRAREKGGGSTRALQACLRRNHIPSQVMFPGRGWGS
jgi:hypothetical protein